MATAIQTSDTGVRIGKVERAYYLTRWIDSFGPSFIYAIYPLFLRSRGLEQFQINLIAAVFFVTTFITDIPTGAFADAVGRRASMIVGNLVSAVAFAVYFVAHRMGLFMVGEIMDGVGSTFRNASLDAWAVDELHEAGFTGTTDRLFSRGSQLWRLASMTGAIVGAYVSMVNIAIPWILGTAGMLNTAVWARVLMRGETRQHSLANLSPREIGAVLYRRIAGGLAIGFSERVVFLMTLANAIQLAAWAQFWFEWQHYFNLHLHRGIWIVGWLFSLFAVGAMLGSEISARALVPPRLRPHLLSLAVAVQGAILLGAGFAIEFPLIVLAMFFLRHVIDGFVTPVYQTWFNQRIAGGHRATLLSFQTTFATFGAAVGLPITGFVADRWGLGMAWQCAALFSLLGVPCYLALRVAPQLTPAPQPAD